MSVEGVGVGDGVVFGVVWEEVGFVIVVGQLFGCVVVVLVFGVGLGMVQVEWIDCVFVIEWIEFVWIVCQQLVVQVIYLWCLWVGVECWFVGWIGCYWVGVEVVIE